MPECKKCKSSIPRRITIDGIRRNLKSRKYCLDCSPFGEHNTKRLERLRLSEKDGKMIKVCPSCGRDHSQKGYKCHACYFRHRQKLVSAKVAAIVGDKCWMCGYDVTKSSLCFHHLEPENKLFGLSTRELMHKWTRVYAEMQKCVFVCLNCHGEIHDGIIEKSRVQQIWKKFWSHHAKTPGA